jgi:hypothetical protein
MARHNVLIGSTGIPQGILQIAETLPDRNKVAAGDEVVFSFTGKDFVYLTGLVLLAAWRKSLPGGVTAKVDDVRCLMPTQNLISNSGFREIVDTGHENPSAQRRAGKLPLRPLTNRLNKDAAVQEVTSILEEYAGHVDDVKPFTTIISELCENALTHSEFASPGYVCARVLETGDQRRAEIAICDTGIGFRQSYLLGTNDEVKARIERGANPIEIAIEGLNSSKPVATTNSVLSYYGFGLYIVRRLVEENRGQLAILSHGDGIHLDHINRRNLAPTRPFPGTFVAVVLDLDNPLPLEEIYDQATKSYVGELPPMAGASPSSRPTSTGATAEPQCQSPPRFGGTVQPQGSTVELRHFGTELLTREAGLAIRAELATRLLGGEAVTVNLDGISDITPSVADEAFAKLAERIGLEAFNRVVVFSGGSSLVRRLIDFVMKARIK